MIVVVVVKAVSIVEVVYSSIRWKKGSGGDSDSGNEVVEVVGKKGCVSVVIRRWKIRLGEIGGAISSSSSSSRSRSSSGGLRDNSCGDGLATDMDSDSGFM